MRSLLLVGMARQHSTRCKDKMTRCFGDTSLFDIYLDKLNYISNMKDTPFSKVILGVNKNDVVLWDKANNVGGNVFVQERSDSSIAPDSVLSSNFSFLKGYDEDFVCWVNGCFPFLRISTVVDVVKLFQSNPSIRSLHCVRLCRNWFWTENGLPITIKDKSLSRTQDSIPLMESVHCFHIFNRKYLLDNCAYWDFTRNNPYLFMVDDSLEFLDIDTETDFRICECIWRNKYE